MGDGGLMCATVCKVEPAIAPYSIKLLCRVEGIKKCVRKAHVLPSGERADRTSPLMQAMMAVQ
jgi:hypothetical protein